MGLKREIIEKRFIKATSVIMVMLLAFSSSASASAVTRTLLAPETGGQIQVYLKPDISIIVKGEERIFRDVNNNIVYPIIYKGSTYLPIRSISALMEENIEWDAQNKIIFLGRTFSDPNKLSYNAPVSESVTPEGVLTGEGIIAFVKPIPTMISAYSRPNFLIAVDFEFQVFKDELGNTVYPIVVNGSTYLPIRAISQIMKETIDWDGINKVITIGSAESEEPPVVVDSDAKKALISQFENQITLYDSATVKIKNLQKAASQNDLVIIATEVSKDYVQAAENIQIVNSMDTDAYTQEEMTAYKSLVEFTTLSEHYILVLENIAYLAANGQDYAMMADTFVAIAVQTENKLNDARERMELL